MRWEDNFKQKPEPSALVNARLQETYAQIYERAQADKEEEMQVRSICRKIVVGALIAAALATTAVAGYVENNPDSAVAQFIAILFGTQERELVEEIGQPLGVSVSHDGYTVTADAVIGERKSARIFYTLTRDDGKTIETTRSRNLFDLFFDYDDMLIDGEEFIAQTKYYDNDPTDNKIQFVQTLDDLPGAVKGHVNVRFETLMEMVEGEDGDEKRTLAEGEWKLEFDLDYADESRRYLTDTKVMVNDVPTRIVEVEISPISIAFTMMQEHEYVFDNWIRYCLLVHDDEVTVTTKDGKNTETVQMMANNASCPEKDVVLIYAEMDFDNVFPVDQLGGITYNGVVLELKEIEDELRNGATDFVQNETEFSAILRTAAGE